MIIDGHHHIEAGYEHILKRMDTLGIDRTVLVGVGVRNLRVVTIRNSFVFRLHFLLRTIGTWRARQLVRSRALREALLGDPVNDRVLQAIHEKPDRFYGFAFVNPESDRAQDEVRRCLAGGMCGIKLALLQYPTDLSGPRMAEICGLAEEHRVPVFFHQGLTPASSDARRMTESFPNVHFIIAHAGVQYYDEAITLAHARDNVFVDTSSYIVTVCKLRDMCRKLGAGKLIFGTDVPVMSLDQGEGLAKIRALPLSDRDRSRILGENLLEILRRNGQNKDKT
jgi:uncharacterized protein